MANIREQLTLEDRFSATFGKFIKLGESATKAMQKTDHSTKQLQKAHDAASRAAKKQSEQTQKLSGAQRQAQGTTGGLTRKLMGLVGAAASLKGIQSLLTMADSISQTTARLDMMNDGLQTTAQLNEMIFRSAQRARGSYADTADLVGKLGNLAGEAFDSSREIVAFAEQINKQIALSGATAAGAQGALLQLTQALSSGTLRGEELNSILEQTPTIARSIANYLGVSIGGMRELASAGKVTAEVVKNAMFAAADETNTKFEQMPKTWAQLWTQFQNGALMAFQPVMQRLSALANSQEMQMFMNNALTAISAVANAAVTAFGWIASAGNFIAENWSTIGPIFYGVAAAIIAYKAATLVATIAQWAMNTAMLASPLTWIVIGIGLVVAALAMLANYLGGVKIAWMMFCDLLVTGWSYVVWGIQWGIVAVQNFLDDFTLKWSQVSVGVQDFMGQMKVGVLTILQNLINGAISMINSFIALLNNLPGVNISAISGVTFATKAALEEGVASSTRNIGLGLEAAAKAGKKGLREGNLAQSFQNIQSEHNQRQMKIMAERLKKGLTAGTDAGKGVENNISANEFADVYSKVEPMAGIGGGVDDIGGSVGGSLGSDVGAIKKEVQMSQEDLKSLVDMAERQYVNQINLTSQTPVINVNGQNTGNTAGDRRALANAIRDILLEQKASSSVRSIVLPT